MSIIKSILHKYNATSKAYDTLHPETESAQITDWNQGIVNTLASTALGGLVNTLTSDSLLAKMIQKVLTATGVKYNIDQNGYICFGSLFGGLIIQWGNTAAGEETNITWNIIFTSKCWQVVGTPDTPNSAINFTEVGGITNSGCFFSVSDTSGKPGYRSIHWICVGH